MTEQTPIGVGLRPTGATFELLRDAAGMAHSIAYEMHAGQGRVKDAPFVVKEVEDAARDIVEAMTAARRAASILLAWTNEE